MKATVYKSTGSWYVLEDDAGAVFNARIKGKFKIDDITSTNPIAVGDRVITEMENELEHTLTITGIEPRRNYITRSSPHNRNQHHIIASNLDQTLLFATIREPRTSLGFIDRFLVTAEAYHIPAILVFNKMDVYRAKDLERFEEIKSMYEAIGYQVIGVSIGERRNLDDLLALLHSKTSLLSGHSGVGKSSFINLVLPELTLRTQDVSEWSGKGLHTTTFAEMFNLPGGGRIIDTPGIRELGLVDISRQELSQYFPEMKVLINDCKFNNCLHLNEPGCAVKLAVEEGRVHYDRFGSYLTILDSIEEKSY